MEDDVVIRRYFYLAGEDDTHHKNKNSAYLVERLVGSNVVARLHSLGMVSGFAPEEMLSIEAMKQDLSFVGDWSETKSKKNKKIRLIQGTDYEPEE